MGLKDRLISLLGGTPAPRPVEIIGVDGKTLGKSILSIPQDSAEGRMIAEMLRSAGVAVGGMPPPQTPEQSAALAAFGADHVGTRLQWSVWDRESRILTADLPGWSPCRFYNRVGPDEAFGVFGAVKGLFGIWRQPYGICDQDHDETDDAEIILPALTHLATGLAMGTFSDTATAAAASEVLTTLDWATMPPADPDEACRAAWADRAGLARKTLAFHGIVPEDRRHAHERGDYRIMIPIYAKADLGAGKPEKLS